MGYPLAYLMELDGMDPIDIERVLKMREEESEAALGIAVQEALDNDLTASADDDAA